MGAELRELVACVSAEQIACTQKKKTLELVTGDWHFKSTALNRQ